MRYMEDKETANTRWKHLEGLLVAAGNKTAISLNDKDVVCLH